MHKPIIAWLEHRTGIQTLIKDFLYEDIPASSGWHQVIGSMAVFSFIIQVFTGILLAFNYAPTPGDSYLSVKYIVTELTGGRLIRGLHHWAAAIMHIIGVPHTPARRRRHDFLKLRQGHEKVGGHAALSKLGL